MKQMITEVHRLSTEDQEKTDEYEHISFDELSKPKDEVLPTSPTVHLPFAGTRTNTDDDLKASTGSKIGHFLSHLFTVKDTTLPKSKEAAISENDDDQTISLIGTSTKIDQNENKTPASETTVDGEISVENKITIQKDKQHTADPTLDIIHGTATIPSGIEKPPIDKWQEADNILDQRNEYIPSTSISKTTSSSVGAIEQPTVTYSDIDRAEQRDTAELLAVDESSLKGIPHVTTRQLEFNTIPSQQLTQAHPDTLDKSDTATWQIPDQVMKSTSAAKQLSEKPLIVALDHINEQYTSTLPTSRTADNEESRESTKDQSDVLHLSTEIQSKPKLINEMATEDILSSMDYSIQQEDMGPLMGAPEDILPAVDQLQGVTIESKPPIEKLSEAHLKEPTTTPTAILFETEQQEPEKDKIDQLEQNMKPSPTIENVIETTSERHVLTAEDISRKETAEHLTSELLTEDAREIVVPSVAVNVSEFNPTADSAIENGEFAEKATTDENSQINKEIDSRPLTSITVTEEEKRQITKIEPNELQQLITNAVIKPETVEKKSMERSTISN